MVFLMSKNDPTLQSNPGPMPTWLSWHAGEGRGFIFVEHRTSTITFKCSQQDGGPDPSSDSELSLAPLELPAQGTGFHQRLGNQDTSLCVFTCQCASWGTMAVKESFTFYWTDEKTKAWREAETRLEWGLPLRWTRKSHINEMWNNSHNYLSVYNMPTVDKVLSYCGDIPSAPQLRDVAREITRPSVCRECHTVQRNMDTSCIPYVAQARDD